MASMHATSAPVRAVRTPAGDPDWSVSGYAKVRALIADSRLSWITSAAGASRYSQAATMAEAAASHNRVALDQQLVDQLPPIVQQAARGLVSQGPRILDSVRQNLGNDAPGTAPAVRQEGDR